MPTKTLGIIQNHKSSYGGYKPGNYIKNILKKEFNVGEFLISNNKIVHKLYKILNNILSKFFNETITLPCLINFSYYKDKKDIIFIGYGNEVFNFNIIKKRLHTKIFFLVNDEWIFNGASHFKINNKNKLLKKINKFFQNYLKKKINNKKNFYFVSSCKYFTKLIHNNYKINKKNVRTIYNPVDTNFWRKKKSNQKNIFINKANFSKNNFYILFIARNGLRNFRKGGDRILKIIESLSKYNNLKFVILGQKKNQNFKLNNIKNCIFINSREETFLKKLYYSCNITIHMSRAEGIPYSMLETMSCSLPTITINAGGISEVIKNKDNGYILKNFNLREIRKLIIKLSLNKSLVKKLGNKSSRTINQKFSFKKIKKEYLNFFK